MIEADLIITGGTVLTMDATNRVIPNGLVAIRGNSILAVESADTARGLYTAPTVWQADGQVIIPGLVDTYGHAGHGLIKGLWNPVVGWPTNKLYFHATTEDWWHAEGLLSSLERLKAGVTCGLTVVGGTPARADSPVFVDAQARAAIEVGIRSVLGVGPPDPYFSHLDRPWQSTVWEDGRPVVREFTYEDALRTTVASVERWHGANSGQVHMALHFPYLFGRQAKHPRFHFEYHDDFVPVMRAKAAEIRALANRYSVLIHSHVFVGSVAYAMEKFGRDEVEGLLGPDVLFAHANGLSEEEVDVLGRARVGISVVPFTHENILYGPCPAVELLQAGANVTVSTDGTAPYTSYDLLKELPRAMWAQWMRTKDQKVLPPGKALRMVTIDAARALRLDHLIGSLEPGKRADLVLVDMNQPHLVPNTLVPRQLALYATGSDVSTVIVDGRILMHHRRVTSVSEDSVLEYARRQAEEAFARFDIRPYLRVDEDFWQGWDYGGTSASQAPLLR